jgi:MraZ protein
MCRSTACACGASKHARDAVRQRRRSTPSGSAQTGSWALEIVDFFLGNALNAVDAKGRVSLPSSYRSVVEKRQLRIAPAGDETRVEKAVTFLVHPDRPCLMGFDNSVASLIIQQIEKKRAAESDAADIFGLHEADLGQFSATWTVTYDPDGRMVLPGFLRDKAGIADLAFFVPAGRTFQLWSPDRLAAQQDANLAQVQEQLTYLLKERRK